jgi:hypothetical protein
MSDLHRFVHTRSGPVVRTRSTASGLETGWHEVGVKDPVVQRLLPVRALVRAHHPGGEVGGAERDGDAGACWELACTISLLFQMRRFYDDWQHILDRALAATTTAGDTRGQAAIHYRLGWINTDRREYDWAWWSF